MSELKVVKQSDVLWGHWFTEFYLKSEADKVIAEKDEELRCLKHKRCLTNAWWCLREEFFAEDCHCEHWVDWAIKWYKRWLAIAEKFKPNSTAM